MLRKRTGLAALAVVALGAPAYAFVPAATTADASRITATAFGSTGSAGSPARITWGFVADGVSVVNPSAGNTFAPSDLISKFDGAFGAGPGGADLTQRPWFPFFQQALDRWGQLAGVTYVYEPHDDGSRHGTAGPGVLGVRPDVRIGGLSIDGEGGTLAYDYFPSQGSDMALDTDDIPTFLDPSNNHRALRNVITHEAGHGLGLDHTNSSDADFLMEPALSTVFDGPQHDDVRGVQWFYGDALEKTNGGLGNNTFQTATPLGLLTAGGTLAVGTGGVGSVIGGGETDFVSISSSTDFDYFSFSINAPTTVDVVLTPRGASYLQSNTQFQTTATSDLSLTLYDSTGTAVIASSASAPAGQLEQIQGLTLTAPGPYYARVSSSGTVVQLYELQVTSASLGVVAQGDFNGDGVVNAADYTAWRDTLGRTVTRFSGADGNGDGQVNQADYAVWAANYGQALAASRAVPEPSAGAFCLAMTIVSRRRRA